MKLGWPCYANVVAVVQFHRYHLPNSQGRRPRPSPVGPASALTGGFCWGDSTQGHDYWSAIVQNLGGWASS